MYDKVKQVIVVRKDLNMSAGKLASQVAHASISFITRGLQRHMCDPWSDDLWMNSRGTDTKIYMPEIRTVKVDEEMAYWLDGSFTKIVVSVPDEKTLLEVYNSAKTHKCRSSLIQDEGRTAFNGVPTYTCVAVGPNYNSKVDFVTKSLPLYK